MATNGATNGARSVIDDSDLPDFEDEQELLGGGALTDDEQRLDEDDEDGEELFGDQLEA